MKEKIEPESPNRKNQGARSLSCMVVVVIVIAGILLLVGHCSKWGLQQEEIKRNTDPLEESSRP